MAVAGLLTIALAACGGGGDNSSSGGSAAGAAAGSTVKVESIDGADLLVDPNGMVLYTNDKDAGSKVACTGECAGVWVPLAAPSGGAPRSDDSAVQPKLGVIDRPDGTRQVTFDGKPLYTFVEDGPEEATGDGASDNFAGTGFTWTAASTGSTTVSDGSGGGGAGSSESGGSSGGYGY